MKSIAFFGILLVVLAVRLLTLPGNLKVGDKVRITSRITTEPLIFDNAQRITIAGLSAYVDRFPEIYYGDKVVIEGIVDKDNKLSKAKLISVDPNKFFLYNFRQKIILFYKSTLPEPDASLLAGVTLGSKSALPENFYNSLKKTGTMHVVVASGMNVAFVGGFLLSISSRTFKRNYAIAFSLLGIWIYTLLSGFDAPLVRAAIMGSIAFSAQALGRIYLSLRALFLSAIVMLIVNPLWVSDLGFILSFVATLSLIIFETKIDSLIGFLPEIFREGLATSLAAQIGVAPILYFTFGNFWIFSPLINALVLWTIGPITIIGMIAGLVGQIVPFLGKAILFLTYPLSQFFIRIVSLF